MCGELHKASGYPGAKADLDFSIVCLFRVFMNMCYLQFGFDWTEKGTGRENLISLLCSPAGKAPQERNTTLPSMAFLPGTVAWGRLDARPRLLAG